MKDWKARMATLCFLFIALTGSRLAGKEKVYFDGILLDFWYSEEINHQGEEHVMNDPSAHTLADLQIARESDRQTSYDLYDWTVRMGRAIYVGRYYADKATVIRHFYKAQDWPVNTTVQIRIERESLGQSVPIPVLRMYVKRAGGREVKTELIHIIGADGVEKCKKTMFRNFSLSGWTCVDAWKN